MIYFPYIALFECLSDKSRYRYFVADCEFTGEIQEIKTDLEKCGTKVSFNSSHVIYKNQVRYINLILLTFYMNDTNHFHIIISLGYKDGCYKYSLFPQVQFKYISLNNSLAIYSLTIHSFFR